jgi:hypothetical protein
MKTIDPSLLQADPVISEVRRVKTALAAKHNFDVSAMVRDLQERDKAQRQSPQVSSSRVRETPD